LAGTTEAIGGVADPFLFIVGCDGSGTTLLRAMLERHPSIAIPDESYFIVRLARRRRYYERHDTFDTDGFLADLGCDRDYQRWNISHDAVARALSERPPRDYSDAIRRVYEVYASQNTKARYGDKTAAYVRHIDELDRLFPDAVFIHVVRDGRDVAQSVVERSAEWPNTIGEAAILWRRNVVRGRRLGASLGDRYVEVRYEDLIRDPRRALAMLCAVAGLRRDDRALTEMLGYRTVANASMPRAGASLRRSRRTISKRDRRLVEEIAGGALDATGYPLAGNSSLRVRILIAPRVLVAYTRWVLLYAWVRSRALVSGSPPLVRGSGTPAGV
jgi:hypothetical protein